jgi:hypothetical protein
MTGIRCLKIRESRRLFGARRCHCVSRTRLLALAASVFLTTAEVRHIVEQDEDTE